MTKKLLSTKTADTLPGTILGPVFANLATELYLRCQNVEAACQVAQNVARAISDFYDSEILGSEAQPVSTGSPQAAPTSTDVDELRDFISRAKSMDADSIKLEAETRWGL